MKLFKSIILAAVSAGCLGFASCSSEGYYDVASQEGVMYSFDNNTLDYVYTPSDNMEGMDLEVTVTRNAAGKAIELPLTVEMSEADQKMLTCPEVVNFANGETQSKIVIKVQKDFEINESAKVKLSIPADAYGISAKEPKKPQALMDDASEEEIKAYKDSMEIFKKDSINYATYKKLMGNVKTEITVNVAKDYTWESIGYGKIADFFEGDGEYYDVEFRQAKEDPSRYQIIDAYKEMMDVTEGYTEKWNLRIMSKGETINGYTLETDGCVYFEPCSTGDDYSGAGDYINVCHPAYLSASLAQNSVYSLVTAYKEDGTPGQIGLAPYYYIFGLGGWNKTTVTGYVELIFPDFVPVDYSAGVAYAGRFIDPDENQVVLADIELGADVASAKAVLIPGSGDDNAFEAVQKIISGELEATEITEDGQYEFPLATSAESGMYSIVVVTFDTEGEAQYYDFAEFNYVGNDVVEETWTETNIGNYTYTLVFGSKDEPQVDEGLVLSQSNEDPSRWKISHIFYDVDFIFTMDDNGYITFEDQVAAAEYGIYVADMHAYYPNDFPQSKYENGKFTFSIGYYQGDSWMNYGTEVFELTGTANASVKAYLNAKSKIRKTLKVVNNKNTKKTPFTMTKKIYK